MGINGFRALGVRGLGFRDLGSRGLYHIEVSFLPPTFSLNPKL